MHSRTLIIKSNLSILDRLNFNAQFEYKNPPLFPTISILKDNPKKSKK
jgi:hypothetical protein